MRCGIAKLIYQKIMKSNFLKNGNAKHSCLFGILRQVINFRNFSKIKQSLNFLIKFLTIVESKKILSIIENLKGRMFLKFRNFQNF